MSNHQQLLYHIVFSTKKRKRLLKEPIRDNLFSYMVGICQNLGGHALIVGGYEDHAHLLVRIPARLSVSDFVGKLKANSSKHLNEQIGALIPFHWQDGYGAFSVSVSAKDKVYQYIVGQVEHHRLRSFEEEYLELLEKHQIEFDSKYVFD